MTDPATRSLPSEHEPTASEPLTTRHMLLGVALFASIWLANRLVAIVVIRLLQEAGLWETAAADGRPVAGDLLGVALSRLGLAPDGAGG